MPEQGSLPPSAAGDLPPPSPELTLIGAHMRAHMATLPRRKRGAYLKALMEVFDEYEASSNIVRLRSPKYDDLVTKARRGAVAWTHGMMSAFFRLDVDRA